MKIFNFTSRVIIFSFVPFILNSGNVLAFEMQDFDFDNDFMLSSNSARNSDAHIHDKLASLNEVNSPKQPAKPKINMEQYNFINGISSSSSSKTKATTDSKPMQLAANSTTNKSTSKISSKAMPITPKVKASPPPMSTRTAPKSYDPARYGRAKLYAKKDQQYYDNKPPKYASEYDMDETTYNWAPKDDAYVPESLDQDRQALRLAGNQINSALNNLERIERYGKAKIIKVVDENNLQHGLGMRVSVDWTGPIEPLMREVAAFGNYKLKRVGISPAIPIIATVIHNDIEIGDIAREVHLQAKERADIVIYPKSKTIEIRYIEMD